MNISVIIPLYNKRSTILRAIDSILKQSITPLEIVIINDGSTDDSWEVVQKLGNPLIRLYSQENAGVSEARNKGAQLARGEWLAFLDADDEWDREFLITTRNLHKCYSDCDVLATAYVMMDRGGSKKSITLNEIPFGTSHGILSNYFQVASLSHPPLWSSAITINKKALQNVGGFPKGIALGEDLLTWAILAVHYKIAYHMEPLSTYFLDGSYSYEDIPTRNPQKPDVVGAQLKMLCKNNPRTFYLRKYIGHWLIMRSSTFMRLGKSKDAWFEAFRSLRFNPYNYKAYAFMVLAFIPFNKNKIFKFLRN